MQLKTLQLINFKNYAEARVNFSSRINVFVGKNGSGKTNLLDAIYYLALTRSAISGPDNFCIRHGEQHFFLKGIFKRRDDLSEITSAFHAGSPAAMASFPKASAETSSSLGSRAIRPGVRATGGGTSWSRCSSASLVSRAAASD